MRQQEEEEEEEEDRRIRGVLVVLKGKIGREQDGEGQSEEEELAVHVRLLVQLRQQEQRHIV